MLNRMSPCGAAGIPDVPGCPPGGAPDDVAAVAVATIVEAASDTAVGWWSGLGRKQRIQLFILMA